MYDFDAMEAVDDLIDEINYEYTEAAYDEIFEELCERVECGELTLEEAEFINDVAFDRYVSEGNVFNKLLDKEYHKTKKYDDAAIKNYNTLRDSKGLSPEERKKQQKEYCSNNSKMYKNLYGNPISKYADKHPTSLLKRPNRIDELKYYSNANPKNMYGSDSDRKDFYKTVKKNWMKDHGNVGKTPEEQQEPFKYGKQAFYKRIANPY